MPVMEKMHGLHERVLLEKQCMEVYCTAHPLSALRQFLERHGVVAGSHLRRLSSGATVTVSGLVIFFHTPPTRSGRRVIFATLEDETGLVDVVILPHVQRRWGELVYTSEILTIRGRLERAGRNGVSISVTARAVLPWLSGDLGALLRRASGQ